MTIEDARKLIPPGWVECSETAWANKAAPNWRVRVGANVIYAIPAPKPEPRRVPMVDIVVEFTPDGWFSCIGVINELGRVAKPGDKWRLDPDAREWVEVRE